MERNIGAVGACQWGKNLIRDFYELGALHTICNTYKELCIRN